MKIKKLFYILLIVLIIIICFIIFKPNKNEKNNPKENPKLEELDNINKEINYFKNENIDRYIDYKRKNKDKDIKQIIKDVNMNLDKEKYVDTYEALNPNTEKILVNKYYYLNENYIPKDLIDMDTKYSKQGMKLVKVAKEAFEELSEDALKEDMNIIAMSSYRSYEYQVNLYNNYVKKDGKEAADTYSARPGFSEHQTGLAIDVYNKKEPYTNFEQTEEFKWMQDNAYKYGFILRFPKEKENETGYQYESWHYRYVGKEIAKNIHKDNITLEEYIATH